AGGAVAGGGTARSVLGRTLVRVAWLRGPAALGRAAGGAVVGGAAPPAPRSVGPGLRRQLAEHGDLGRGAVRAVHGGPGDEHVGAGGRRPGDRVARDAAVDLDPDVGTELVDRRACAPDLREHAVDEALPAEAG